MPSPVVFWFRRDLRLSDHPALAEASADGPVIPLFIDDPVLRQPAGANRLAFLAATLTDLDAAMGGQLVVRSGAPLEVLRRLLDETGASRVYATDDFGPYGRVRDTAVGEGLAAAGATVHYRDSPYAVAPGTVLSGSGTPYRVFTPFSRAWAAVGWAEPGPSLEIDWYGDVPSDHRPAPPTATSSLPVAGERGAWEQAERFLDGPVFDYAARRDDPGVDGTSRLSPYLKWGSIHPRQLLSSLGPDPSEEVFRKELCWREFYADVLFHRPDSARQSYAPKMAQMEVDSGPLADERFEAWCQGRTGYPIVDAGMRQLVAEGWMHNRVRMIVASFLVKDLHLDWTRGARFFMDHLVDGDLASNQHGWQWVAGTGTDASPYFRVFNPTTQSRKFDPSGRYLRHWLPELADLDDRHVHEPPSAAAGPPPGYPAPIVDHALERQESLARYQRLKDATS